ncbi:MAG: PIN domain-containing protein [Roseimicrobium sp.]
MKFLLDAMVVSEPTKRIPTPQVMEWLATHDTQCAVSLLTLGEVERGIVDMEPSKRKQRLVEWFEEFTEKMAERGRILPVDRTLMSFWGPVYNRELRLTRRIPPFLDTLLAATAQLHGLTMVTRNEKDFPADLALVNPWKL